jgi:hypothetical protein
LDFLNDGGGITILLGRTGVMNGETRPGTGKPQGDRAADLASSAGHQGGAAVDAERGKGSNI